MLRLFEAERGLMWTAHPRIKSSFKFPDQYKDTEFFRSDRFLGAAWKAMPADLSRPTLGWRVLDLLDDMSNWGAKKHVLGEVDTFRMEPDFETYAHMNINYLRLAKLPRYDDGWQPVLDALRGGEFFTTTGEVLIPEFTVGGKAKRPNARRRAATPRRRWKRISNGPSRSPSPKSFPATAKKFSASASTSPTPKASARASCASRSI